MRFFVIKRKSLCIGLVILLAFASIVSFAVTVATATPKPQYTIIIDAGHGGIDPGCEGTLEGSNERELNLQYAKTLKRYFETYGFNVVMTRTTTDGLYSSFAQNKKKDDMQKRKEIIDKADADLILSIHMNAFPQTSVRGAQVYYNPESEVSTNLARSIQETFVSDLPQAKKNPGIGDYYILNCSNTPAVIIECGFLSNPEEEKLLLSQDYQEKICYSILCGVIKYFG